MKRMKNLVIWGMVALCAISYIVVGCDDSNSNSIVGTWMQVTALPSDETGTIVGEYTWIFRSDNTFTFLTGNDGTGDSGIYSINGNMLTLTFIGKAPKTYPFTINNNRLCWTMQGFPIDICSTRK